MYWSNLPQQSESVFSLVRINTAILYLFARIITSEQKRAVNINVKQRHRLIYKQHKLCRSICSRCCGLLERIRIRSLSSHTALYRRKRDTSCTSLYYLRHCIASFSSSFPSSCRWSRARQRGKRCNRVHFVCYTLVAHNTRDDAAAISWLVSLLRVLLQPGGPANLVKPSVNRRDGMIVCVYHEVYHVHPDPSHFGGCDLQSLVRLCRGLCLCIIRTF